MRRDVHAEAARQHRDPRELVGTGRHNRPSEPLQSPLEVQRRAVALERCGRGQDQVGPAPRELVEHRHHEHAFGLLCERPNGRIRSGLVARDDEHADRLGARLLAVRRRRPRGGHSASVGCHGEMEGAGAGLALESELVRELGDPRSSSSARPGPDEDGPLGLSQAPAELVRGVGQLAAEGRCPTGRRRHRAHRRADGDLRSTATGLLDPEVDDRRALDHRVVPDDDHELRLGDRGQRQAKRLEQRSTWPRPEPPSASRPPRAAAARARRRSPSSPSRRAR